MVGVPFYGGKATPSSSAYCVRHHRCLETQLGEPLGTIALFPAPGTAESSHHTSWLDLQAISLAIKHWCLLLRGRMAAIQANKCTAISYIMLEGGTCSHSLMALTRSLLLLAD